MRRGRALHPTSTPRPLAAVRQKVALGQLDLSLPAVPLAPVASTRQAGLLLPLAVPPTAFTASTGSEE